MYRHLNPKRAAVLFQRCVRARQIVRMLEEQRCLIAMQGPHSQVVYCCFVKDVAFHRLKLCIAVTL